MFEVYDQTGAVTFSTSDRSLRLVGVVRVYAVEENVWYSSALRSWNAGSPTVFFCGELGAEDEQEPAWSISGTTFSYSVPYVELMGYFLIFVQ
jgi:hypothetical protein